MPMTRDIRELEPDVFGEQVKLLPAHEREHRFQHSMTTEMLARLDYLSPLKGRVAGPGFVVQGTAENALRQAHAVIANDIAGDKSVSAGEDVWVVLFSHEYSCYVHLDRIEGHDRTIDIRYRFAPHKSNELTSHFALIPIGRLSPGQYRVEMIALAIEDEFVRAGFKPTDEQTIRRVVCQSFSFSVLQGGAD
jgi:hypothetical protein